ncbi:aminotransferase class V-fold PLP-dependent enzyme [Microbacterium rhizomatis]|uniref:Aminotransferase class V-fold PLP-dependent enzyme n=1 Tax=Microbacterium rhizomatis TaxID=1631477 RepID=A0A5J5J493_9MICO|nr:aminotransferase class V-fold PLP-dependent enzyme [Microbacterium rhizomatis]KAA9108068.1 aminotransferase class V-fold PLP-dependent enzyme [Microbacterium rhizomatis]
MSSVDATDAAPGMAEPTDATRPRLDLERERLLTRGATLSRHFNAAGSALPSVGVLATVVDHLRLEEARGGYEAAAQARDRVDDVYAAAAELVGATASEIALFDSASTGLRVMLDSLRLSRGDRIVASTTTYVSHALHLMTLARELDIELVIAPVDGARRVDVEALDALLSDGRPTLLSVAHIPTSSGLVEPVAQIGAVARTHGATYILDATQSTGHLRTDVVEAGCDILVTTGRKFLRSPRGTAFAYVRAELLERLLPLSPDVRGAQWTEAAKWELTPSARRFESWESSVANRLGLGTAIREALDRGVTETQEWLCRTGDDLRSALAGIDGVTLADPAEVSSAIVTFTVEGVEASAVALALADRNVRVVSVPATHGQWDLGARGIPSVVRASPHVYNDAADFAALLEGVEAIASGNGTR